ncbi:hypothetical protein F4782DRAFT_534694 [Xylaria castorea]|nr:hypothetical protein F4782DRAFT_534694 [Xylaria castorea]
MATNSSTGVKPFDKGELEYVRQTLRAEAIDPEGVLQGIVHYDSNEVWEDITSWIGDLNHYKNLMPDIYLAGPTTAALWERSKDTKFTIKELSPILIFLTVPDSVTDIREAWRGLLCTLICEISDFATHVPSEKLSESGVQGGQFVRKYFNCDDQESDDEVDDDINALIELLSALQHCDYETGYSVLKNGATAEVNYVYVVVIDRIKRFSDNSDSDYSEEFSTALRETLVDKMGAYILFIDEMDGAENMFK